MKRKSKEKEETPENISQETNPQTETVDEQAANPTENQNAESGSAEDLSAKLADINDKYLRLYSEFDNYRKRTIKERIELSKTASEEIITNLLPVLDDFDRALKSVPANIESDPFTEGIKLIYSKFKSTLTIKGLEEINAIGTEFNTDFHEAITNIPAENPNDKGKVMDEIQKGYTLNGKVIRFAKVVIGA